MQITVTQARRRWREVLDRVERGETIAVSRRGKVAAVFVPEPRIGGGAFDQRTSIKAALPDA